MKEYIKETVDYLKNKGLNDAETGIILGTGLGKFTQELDIEKEISYNHIPNFPTATVEFHKGKLIVGKIGEKKVLMMQGRFHLYEGYTAQEVSFPVRIMKELGVKYLLVSNASGAINLNYNKGELMLVDDHINLQGTSPLAATGINQLGNIFVDMIAPYDVELNKKLKELAKDQKIKLHEGVYASVLGPQLETRAEYRMLKILGADAVGMSTVPEIIVANQIGLRAVAISVITDTCDPDNLEPINIKDIIEQAEKAEPNLITLFKLLIEKL